MERNRKGPNNINNKDRLICPVESCRKGPFSHTGNLTRHFRAVHCLKSNLFKDVQDKDEKMETKGDDQVFNDNENTINYSYDKDNIFSPDKSLGNLIIDESFVNEEDNKENIKKKIEANDSLQTETPKNKQRERQKRETPKMKKEKKLIESEN